MAPTAILAVTCEGRATAELKWLRLIHSFLHFKQSILVLVETDEIEVKVLYTVLVKNV